MSKPIALITGGHGDLASGIARELQSQGYLVHAPSRQELDVTDRESVERYFGSLDRLDLLINNAGLTRDGLFLKQTPEEWSAVIDTNLKGAHLCAQAATLLMMRQRDGQIIQIGSYSAEHPPKGQTAYAAAKAGLVGLTKSLAREYGGKNLRANCVLPGFLETKMTAPLSDQARSEALDRHQLRRFNTVEEAARFIAFLASTEHISGQVFQLDSRA